MKTFEFTRPADAAGAVATAAKAKTAQQGADIRFIAGGTTLVDLMKLSVETPAQVVDINRLPLDKIEALPNGGLKIGATVRNSDLANDATVKRDYSVLSQAILAGRFGTASQHGDDGRKSAAAHAVRLLSRSRHAVQQTGAGQRLSGDHRPQSHARGAGHERTLHCHEPVRHVRRHGGARGDDSRARAERFACHPDRRFSSLARRHAAPRDRAGTRRPDHACRAAAAEIGKQALLFEAARPSFVRIRAGLGGGHSRNRKRNSHRARELRWAASGRSRGDRPRPKPRSSARPANSANFRKAAEAAMRDAKPQSENGFKIELAKRCLTHALETAAKS